MQFEQGAGWPVAGSRINVDVLGVPVKFNILFKVPAIASYEPVMRWLDNQLSSMKRRIEVWSVKV